jgi:hypothetical protein
MCDKITVHLNDLVEEKRSIKPYEDVKILPYLNRIPATIWYSESQNVKKIHSNTTKTTYRSINSCEKCLWALMNHIESRIIVQSFELRNHKLDILSQSKVIQKMVTAI